MADKNQNKNQMMQKYLPFFPMFDQAMDWPMFSGKLYSALTNITVYEDDNNVVIEAPMPGLTNKDVEVTFDKGYLHICGNKKQEVSKNDAGRKYYSQSRTSYNYNVPVPGNVDEKKEPKAKFCDGMMKVIFSKQQKKERKKIPIK